MTRGISGTGYLERFGGFGQHRELGCLMHQIMTIMDFLQVGNLPAARDATALLTVTFRPSKSPALARGTPSHGVLPQACQCPCEDKGIHSVGFPTVGDRCTCVHSGARCPICKDIWSLHKPDLAKPLRCNLSPPIRQSPSRLAYIEGSWRRKARMLQLIQGSQKTNAYSDCWLQEGPEPNPLVAKITFQQWIACLPRWILRTRAKFAALLARSFAILRRSEETATTLFPLPLPSLECFRSSGPNLSRKRHCPCVDPVC